MRASCWAVAEKRSKIFANFTSQEKVVIPMTASEAIIVCLVATVGHLMALFWLCVEQYEIELGRDRIYDPPIRHPQVRRELKNSLHTPLHAVMLMVFLSLGCFTDRSVLGFIGTLLLTAVWAEIWR